MSKSTTQCRMSKIGPHLILTAASFKILFTRGLRAARAISKKSCFERAMRAERGGEEATMAAVTREGNLSSGQVTVGRPGVVREGGGGYDHSEDAESIFRNNGMEWKYG